MKKQYFPMKLPLDVMGHLFDQETAEEHIQKVGNRIFPPGFKQAIGLFETPEKRQIIQEALRKKHSRSSPEWIVFIGKSNQTVGWFYGYMEDEETFFIDTIGLIPEYRGAGIYTAFLKELVEYLKAKGYERVTTSHLPNNRAALIADLKNGFTIVGMKLDESHGATVKMACSLYEDRRRAFEKAFSLEEE